LNKYIKYGGKALAASIKYLCIGSVIPYKYISHATGIPNRVENKLPIPISNNNDFLSALDQRRFSTKNSTNITAISITHIAGNVNDIIGSIKFAIATSGASNNNMQYKKYLFPLIIE
jgi:hypothetical protein